MKFLIPITYLIISNQNQSFLILNYAEDCNEWPGPPLRPGAWAPQKRRSGGEP